MSISVSKIYEIAGLYDIFIGLPLILMPGWLFATFNISGDPKSPFVAVTAISLLMMGFLLLHYADRAQTQQAIGYASIGIRFYYTIYILVLSFSMTKIVYTLIL